MTWITPASTLSRSLLVLATATLLAPLAQAQPAAPSASPGAAVPTAAAATEPRYNAADIARAFSFMDTNKDGKISREEASGFRGVAKHFDEADTNKDSSLSAQEFESAMNQAKSR